MIDIKKSFNIESINIFSSKSVYLITFIISLLIFLTINIFINSTSKTNNVENNFDQIISQDKAIRKDNVESISDEKNTIETEKKAEIEEENLNWYLQIPSINLRAPIKETTNMEVLNVSVGHFEDTPSIEGNIGLAGHNRGYKKNYFENLKNIKKGDKILYKYFQFEKQYIVDKIEIIKNTDWSYLENTKDNKVTLITCVENKPNLRLCVQATEK